MEEPGPVEKSVIVIGIAPGSAHASTDRWTATSDDRHMKRHHALTQETNSAHKPGGLANSFCVAI